MDKDLDEGIKGFQLSLEESEKVLLYNHVNGSSLLVSGRKALEFSCFWFIEYAVIYFSPRPHRLHWRNLKTQLLRLGLPSTLIRHENEAFRKRYSNRRNLATPALRLLWTENIWITGLYETQVQ